jgi:hypothetical protein
MAQKKDFLLRIDPAVWNQLQAWAGDELRSVNGQIEFILRKAIEAHGRKVPPDQTKDDSKSLE